MGTGKIVFIGEVKESDEASLIEIYPDFCSGLLGLGNYSHLIVFYWLHQRDDEKNRETLVVKPPRHDGVPRLGVFACRSPSRPNPIGHSIVRLIEIEECFLEVMNLDAFVGSPIIDIKPYSPRSDSIPDARAPEWSRKRPPT
jgi:tRNA-Thr(GGU) m(6)t(6)A37 methyltransferase TsaA